MTTHSIKQIKTSLYASKAPLEWAVSNNGTLYTAQIPIDENGDVVAGGIEAQARQTLDNLKHTLECANVVAILIVALNLLLVWLTVTGS